MNRYAPFTVTITITERHLARGVVGCAAECPIALAPGERDELSPALEVIVGGRTIDLYRDNVYVLVAPVDPRTHDWMIRYDGEEEVETPFTTTLKFKPVAAPAERPVGHPEE